MVSELKSTQSEQSAKLQAKHEAEQDLLEDVRNYAKQRASIEKEYSQAILRITSQSLTKMASAAVKGQPTTTTDDTLVETEAESEDSLRTPQGLWKKILEETESMANMRMKVSQRFSTTLQTASKTSKLNVLPH